MADIIPSLQKKHYLWTIKHNDMRQLFHPFFLILLLLPTALARAGETTIDFSAQGYANAQDIGTVTSGEVTLAGGFNVELGARFVVQRTSYK